MEEMKKEREPLKNEFKITLLDLHLIQMGLENWFR